MANSMKDVFSKWGRSPRQDRRVVVNGKFVELTDPIHPTPEPEEVNTALEVVHEPVNTISGTEFEEGRYENEGGASAGTDVPVAGEDGLEPGYTTRPENDGGGDSSTNAEPSEPASAPEATSPAEPEVIVGKTFTFVERPPIPQEIIDYLKSTQDEAEKASGLMKENPDVEPD